MLNKVKEIFDKRFVTRKKYDELNSELVNVVASLKDARLEIEGLKLLRDIQKKTRDKINVVGFDDNECEPSDDAKRLEYIKEVDFFYDSILRDKLKTSIADIREMLSNIHVATDKFGRPLNMQRSDYDWFLRGMESLAWKMNEWALGLKAERKAKLQEEENNK